MATRNPPTFPRLHPSAILLAAQLTFLVLYAAFDGLPVERSLISAFNVIVLVLRLWVIKRSPAVDWVAWLLAVPAFVLSLLSAANPHLLILASSTLVEAALYFYAAASMIAYMMEDNEVTTDELFAAGATFTLLAWGFAHLFLACQELLPGSFLNTVSSRDSLTFIELLFLSFTNLSATGLSDIVPVSTAARILLMLEQFSGVAYVAVVVSRLVGLTLQRQSRRRP